MKPRLAPIANRWSEELGREERYPAELEAFLTRCRAAGQAREAVDAYAALARQRGIPLAALALGYVQGAIVQYGRETATGNLRARGLDELVQCSTRALARSALA